MSRQAAGGEAMQDLPSLLRDILADLESALNSARNQPARRLLQERIDRLRSAIDAISAAEPPPRSAPDPRDVGRLLGA